MNNSNQTWYRDWVFWMVTGMILIISVLHYSTTLTEAVFHDIYRRLYYIPIIIAAFRYQLVGGVGASVIISLIYLPHLISHWGISPEQGLNKLLELVLYNVVGILSGVLVTNQEKERQRYEDTANQLDQSLQELQAQSKRLIEMEENLRVADRLAVLGELTASLAHEVRNPLGSITGSAKLLANDELEPEEKEEVAEILMKEAERMNQVVENYLSAARTEPKSRQKFQLNEVLTSVQRLLAEKTRKRNITFSMRLPNQPVNLTMDRNHLYQILINLLLNAIDAMPEGGTISLSATTNSGKLQLIVEDQGKGIPQEEVANVWNTFYTTKQEGTGLGLPIVKRIVEEYEGQISLESELDKGTKVTIIMPQE
ncbi:MAG: GHKL domain-containing protein [Candidatus Marinimicrobia bacterium]|nr:GHKL domain-containing protein [Candidatus Neomarinimicrobiota bacterium]MCF7830332.1 GHKL domain-containing protein [Candidatus Neomarinimicrobiota bacterium]MCF7882401.1 GHKL domain-containing protein [Candidatus Neomarinimicrobiota bacterium]